MQCPIDQTELVMSERQGIEIDYCPKCRGVWLDRGELDKIIERANSPKSDVRLAHDSFSQPDNNTTNYQSSTNHSRPPKKKESFLSDLFDF